MAQTKTTPLPASASITVDEKAAAEAIGMSVFWLQKDRQTNKHIPFYRVGGRVRYDLARVREALLALEEGGAAIKPRRNVGATR